MLNFRCLQNISLIGSSNAKRDGDIFNAKGIKQEQSCLLLLIVIIGLLYYKSSV